MTNTLQRFAYGASQGLRVSWFWGQKLVAASRSERPKLPPEISATLPDRARLLRDLRRLLARDWRNIADGIYAMPANLVPNPVAELRRCRRFLADLKSVEQRRTAGARTEVAEQQEPGRYPRYYLQNFHFQTDGYLSESSAALYDHQVEVLFGGAADAMRRQALVPLRDAVARRGARHARLLDIGCGTGRFLREVKHNHPRLAVTALDLSPFYLDAARRHLAPWSRCDFVLGLAEQAPLAAASFDVVTAIYLFHELPPKQRRLVAGEIARLLRPGGVCIFLDSLQHGDEPDYDGLLDQFPHTVHEPYFASYVVADLTGIFGAAGLCLESAEPAYFSKLAVFRKT
ncbi:MAG: class SAM-dependent methyltransferase [Rhodospirillales bacterium]|nr:class SAM-dependent methyltransferase [Rhodospirillales bacterium]